MTARMCYLAYPIDQAESSSIAAIRFFDLVAAGKMSMMNHRGAEIIFDPGDAFSVGHMAAVGPEIAAINAVAASQADCIMAFMPAGTASVGVPMEIDRGVRAGKRVAIITDAKSWMLDYGSASNARHFPLDGEGVAQAVRWLSETPAVVPGQDQDLLPFQVLDGGTLPTRGHADDAGLDLYVSTDTFIPAHRFIDVPCAVRVELPEWAWGMLTGRSSTLRNRGLLVHTGIIDAGYRGDLFVGVWNQTDEDKVVAAGVRLAQLILMPNITRDVKPSAVDGLNPSQRGTNGFGSTGA